eukprot:TRINITY_DN5926_c0_g1_i1.p1 TRINITY_DN5926_c0_g1~~TRINITY_DN5926_c0_g1_i1.p1  ORF type:complete len:382 (-),score=52.62 TRINITY_DN5926_c0_g1_i1:8-1114(-)
MMPFGHPAIHHLWRPGLRRHELCRQSFSPALFPWHLQRQQHGPRFFSTAAPSGAPPPNPIPPFLLRFGPPGLAVALLLAKWKTVLVVLKAAKLAPLLQVGASVVAYSFFFGWQYSVGAVALLFVHELGHYVALKAYGLDPGPIVFVPFLGAAVQMNRFPASPFSEAVIALSGPIVGGVVSIAVLGYAMHTGYPLAGALAHFGVLVNLLNLIPMSPLDGGRVMKVIDKRFLLLGVPIFAFVAYIYSNPILILFLVMGAVSTLEELNKPASIQPATFRPHQRAFVALIYVVCAAVLLLAFDLSEEVKVPVSQLDPGSESGVRARIQRWYADLTGAIEGSGNSDIAHNPEPVAATHAPKAPVRPPPGFARF